MAGERMAHAGLSEYLRTITSLWASALLAAGLAGAALTVVHETRGGWYAGLGTVLLAIKWRLPDWQELSCTLSTYPRFSTA